MEKMIRSTAKGEVSDDMTDSRFERIGELVKQEMDRAHVPGVVLGVWHDGQETIAGFGVTSVEHPLPVTADTLYQIGSITKTVTATVLMRLVEQGRVGLDVPLRAYIPSFRMQDASVAQRVTLRHLLTHTGGWVGDYFDDTGTGDDALGKMVDRVGRLPQLTPLGEIWSYNNAGFYIAGRVIEIITGKTYEVALREFLLEPLGMQHAFLTADEVITHRFAVGHVVADERAQVARPWALPRCVAPVGGLITHASNLFRYARFHMGDGTTPEGVRLLTPASLEAMHTPFVPAGGLEWVGLSWFIQDIDGVRVLRHSGGTKGQATELTLVPARQFALALLTNCDEGSPLKNQVRPLALKEYLGLEWPQPTPIRVPVETLRSLAGQYDSAMETCEIVLEGEQLILHLTEKGGFPTPDVPPPPQQPPPVRLALYGEDRVIALDNPMKDSLGEFLRDATGQIAWFRIGGRVHARI